MSDYGYMTDDMKPNRIAEWRKKKGLTQQQLADAVGAHWITISKLERGKMRLTTDWLRKLAEEMQLASYDLMANYATEHKLHVAGDVINGLTIIERDESVETVITEDEDDFSNAGSEWLRIIGTDLEPYYYDGDTIKISYYSEDSTPFLIGRLAKISLFDGRVLLAVLDRHVSENRYDIRSVKGHLFQDQPVDFVAVVTAHLMKLPIDPRKRLDDYSSKKIAG